MTKEEQRYYDATPRYTSDEGEFLHDDHLSEEQKIEIARNTRDLMHEASKMHKQLIEGKSLMSVLFNR
tara:strand:- start:1950 stop:2153 length:204 start_codon:yes stop_codon:yes gene_type:complete